MTLPVEHVLLLLAALAVAVATVLGMAGRPGWAAPFALAAFPLLSAAAVTRLVRERRR